MKVGRRNDKDIIAKYGDDKDDKKYTKKKRPVELVQKQKGIKFTELLISYAWENIKFRSLTRLGRPESFTEYIHNLILEDWRKHKKDVVNAKKEDS